MYCTCVDCTDRFLSKKNGLRQALPKMPRLPWTGARRRKGEDVRPHPADCRCATCNLLRSVNELPALKRGGTGFWKRLLGKR